LQTLSLGFIPPMLNVRTGPGGIEMAYFETEPGLVLESTDSLAPPDWQPVIASGGVVLTAEDEHRQILLPPTGTARYIRLRQTAQPSAE